MRQLSVYTSKESFETLVLENFDKPGKLYSEVYIAVSKAEITLNINNHSLLVETSDQDSILSIFEKNFPSTNLKGCDPIKFDSDTICSFACQNNIDILLLEEDNKFIEIESKIGLCRINVNNKDLPKPLAFDFYKDIKKGKCHQKSSAGKIIEAGWPFILSSIELSPANAIIIQDNYLFHNHPETVVENVVNLISKYFNASLILDFEVLILSINPKLHSYDWFKDFIDQISFKIKKSISNKFQISLVIHSRKDLHHKRIIISNHSFGYSDQTFNTFKLGLALEKNDISIKGNFHGINSTSEIPLETSSYWLKIIKDTTGSIKTLESCGISEPTKMTIGNCENRLLKKA